MQEAGEFRLLTQLDEQELFGAIEKGLQINELLEISGNTPTPEEEQLLIELVAAHQVVFNCNLRLVISIAKKYAVFDSMPAIDLIQEGNIGLSTAIRRTDINRGLKFSTYATSWIRQNITRAIGDKSRLIRMPVHLHEQYLKYTMELSHLTNTLDRKPTLEEIIEATGRSKKQIMTFMTFGPNQLRSLDAELDDDKDTILNMLPDQNAWNLDTWVEELDQAEDVAAIFEGPISQREKLVISLRFGVFREELTVFDFGDQTYEEAILDGPKTLDEVGGMLGVTRERIRQIEKKAMDIIRDQVF